MHFVLLSFILVALIFPASVSAHAFGQIYNLPIPFWMYSYGGAAALLVSFLVIGYFANKTDAKLSHPTFNLSKFKLIRFLTHKRMLGFFKGSSVFLLFLSILTGLIGADDFGGFNMTFFWIIFFLGFTYLTALIGNVYEVINPWKVIVEKYEKKLNKGGRVQMKYPKNLSYYPAVLLYVILIWIELVGGSTSSSLSILLIQYTGINIFGVYFFGKNSWFKYGEFFSVFFRLIGKMAPIEYKNGKIYLRPPFVGLLKEKAEHMSLLVFILFMLSSTAFDGFKETATWRNIYFNYYDQIRLFLGEQSFTTVQTIGLILFPLIFLLIYYGLIALMKLTTRTKLSINELALQFAFSLVPIAFVYNVAHYYTLVITEGEGMIRLVSDPFGYEWNLFGTVDWYSSLSVLDANFVWHSQVGLILAGHIAGVYLAHLTALKLFSSRRNALLSQLPMLILMVIYTVIGLWILSQPISSGAPS